MAANANMAYDQNDSPGGNIGAKSDVCDCLFVSTGTD